MNKTITIGTHTISQTSPTFIVAEMLANHNQDYSRALEILHVAKEAGANLVKTSS